jgi:ATP-dependent Lon protease
LGRTDASDCSGGHPASFWSRDGDDICALDLRPAESLSRSYPCTPRRRHSGATWSNCSKSGRGNGKSYTFSEFSPYATLLGAPTSAATLFWNAQRKQVGVIGYWDVVAFDEVGEGVVVRDKETFQVMKQYMANGNFNRGGSTVTANASLAFVGNVDDSVEAIVNSYEHDLFTPLHPVFDLAILDRFHTYVPGWEIPKNRDESLARNYGLIIEYLAEAFHYLSRNTNRFAYAKSVCKLGKGYDQRDQTAVLKTVCAFLKMLHPGAEPSPEEMEEYLRYAIEGRRRVKEQLNKRKPDDEFANINLSFVNGAGEQVVVYCPESRTAEFTQKPVRTAPTQGTLAPLPAPAATVPAPAVSAALPAVEQALPKERHYRIHYGATGYSYETISKDYLASSEDITVEDPYIRAHHQIVNFLRFCETAVKIAKPKRICLITNFDDEGEKTEALAKLSIVSESLRQYDVQLEIQVNSHLHDREIRLSSGWTVKIGRGFDIYQRPDDWLNIGANDLDLRPCLETTVDVYASSSKNVVTNI